MTDYQKQLVTDNHNLIYRFLQKEKLNMEDWYDLSAIGMCKAAKTFNEGTSKFSTYAFKCMFNEVYSEKKKSYVKGQFQKMRFYIITQSMRTNPETR